MENKQTMFLKNNSADLQQKFDGWSEPIPLTVFGQQKTGPFPIELLPPVIGDYITQVAEETQTVTHIGGMLSLAVLALAVAKKYVVNPYGQWMEPLNLFVLIASPSGTGKSPVFRHLLSPVYEYEQMLQQDWRESKQTQVGEKAVSPLNPPRLTADDVTVEKLVGILLENQERLGIFSPEGDVFENIAGRYSNDKSSHFTVFLKAYSGEYCVVDRMTRTEILRSPLLTLGITVQPEVIKNLAKNKIYQQRGLLARFLFTFPNSFVGFRNPRPRLIEQKVKEQYERLIQQLLAQPVPDHPKVLTLSREADERMIRFKTSIEKKLAPERGELAPIVEWGNKHVGVIYRIAGLLHVAENTGGVPQEIALATVEKAIQFSEYFIQQAKIAFDAMGTDQSIEDAQYVLKSIRGKGEEVKYQDIWQATKKRCKNANTLKSVLRTLEEHMYIKPKVNSGNDKGLTYLVNPFVLLDTSHPSQGNKGNTVSL
ncbi:uncharacterized protein DUF3987 [Aneurinibacillus soli]|uniref:Uncharacterized protein n=1 Tax=Aneurinibacillus soli TaxID=1500254 RepID=A0A0U5CAG2_9BACL|nr:YfjI family protein [Aneurinibacillus soli]PYE61915.1 uncharacterized protein DUF3987 [Aneurinibacillus soli]BAU29731.1 hypothetical protein CB4_03968 [Aneurinibacillus soli]